MENLSRRAAQKFKNRCHRLVRGFLGKVMADDGDQKTLVGTGEKMRLRVCLGDDANAVALA